MLWAGDCRRKLLVNISAYGKDVGLLTQTAPGEDLLPWDRSKCSHGPGVGCSGKKYGCVVVAHVAREFNLAFRATWSANHRIASGRARYAAAKLGGTWRLVAQEWELQARGVLHKHVVPPMGTAAERRGSYVYANTLRELAPRTGLGFVDTGKPKRVDGVWLRPIVLIPPDRAARYLAKYLASVDGSKLALTETVQHPDVPPHVMYVGRHLTAETGCTMRSLRARRVNWRRLAVVRHLGGDGWARVILAAALEQDQGEADAVKDLQAALGP